MTSPPKLAIPPAVRKAHRASQAAMLQVEAHALAALRATVGHVVRAHGFQGVQGALQAPGDLSAALPPVILAVRRAARQASRRTLHAELAVAKTEAARHGVILPPLAFSRASPLDEIRAAQIGHRYAADFAGAAHRAIAGEVHSPLRTAEDALGSRIETIAATETAEAFSAEREDAADDYAKRYAGSDWLPALLKVWDSTIDRGTCRECADLDGQMRPWGFNFAGGEIPGAVHARCRCSEHTLFLPLYLSRKRAADEDLEAA